MKFTFNAIAGDERKSMWLARTIDGLLDHKKNLIRGNSIDDDDGDDDYRYHPTARPSSIVRRFYLCTFLFLS